MARRGKGGRAKRVATPAVAALAGLPVGAELLASVAGLDLSALPGFDLPLVLRAVYRLGNHVRALLLDVVAEIMHRKDPDGTRAGEWDAVGVHEVRAALALSRTAANSLNHLAQDLHERLPQVLAAMRDGRLDQPRARVFSSWTALLSAEHAQAVVNALLPIAPTLTTGELIDEIRRVAIELDPDFAQRDHDHGRSQRRVYGAIGRDGTGHITAEGLTADQIAASCDRLDAIGWYLKRAGYPGRLDHIRADVFAGLLTGEYAGLTDEQLIEKLLATIPPGPDPSTSDSPADGTDGSSEPDATPPDGPGETSPDEPTPTDDGQETPSADPVTVGDGDAGEDSNPADDGDPAEDQDGGPADHQGDGPAGEGPADDEDGGAADEGPSAGPGRGPRPPAGGPSGSDGGAATPTDRSCVDDRGPDRGTVTPAGRSSVDNGGSGPPPPTHADDSPPGHGPPGTGPGDPPPDTDDRGGRVRVHRRGLRLWVGLGTIAGRDRRPGELLGWSLLHAELARQVTAAPGASWWYVLTDASGQPSQVGLIRRRPTRPWWDGPATPGHNVEVWLQATAAELAALVADPPPGWQAIVADIAHRVAHTPAGAPNGDPADRFPTAGLRRFLAIRDRRCAFPGCRVPSHRTDVDHTIDYTKGGPTRDTNLTHLCRPDHDLKTTHGWHAEQIAPGRLRWTSRLGHTYHRTAPRGPNHAHPPLPNPPGPEHDWFHPLTDDEYQAMLGITPPPEPRNLPDDDAASPIACLTSDLRADPNAPPTPSAEPAPTRKRQEPDHESKRCPISPKPARTPASEDDPIPF